MINVLVTATEILISSTAINYPVTVSSDNNTFTITNQVSNFTVTNVTPVIMFNSDGGTPFDFAIKHRGEWDADASYTRNDVVRYQNSIYICGVLDTVILQSSYPPPDDPNTANWELFYWNQWTKQYLTITNFLNVGGTVEIGGTLTVNDNATIYGDLATSGDITTHFISATELLVDGNIKVLGISTLTNVVVTNTATFYDVNINNQLTIGGLKYPKNKGTYGQVLFTGGDETSMAAWVNLGELVFWSLSNDLLTNGFNIVSGHNTTTNHPQLTIGTGDTTHLTSYIRFDETPYNVIGDITIYGDALHITAPNTDVNNLEVGGDADLKGDVVIREDLTGFAGGAVRLGSGGIRFSDGTIQTSAVATFTSTQIASTTTLGVIRVGDYLSINSSTGALSVNTASITGLIYTLPIASTSTLGGIRIGSGLSINTTTGVMIVNTATTSTLGVVSVGTTLSINSTTGALNVGAASSSTRGGIRVGYGLEIVDGDTLNVNTTASGFIVAASTTTRGGIRVGTDFTITSGDILNLGTIQLRDIMYVNGYQIRNVKDPYGRDEQDTGAVLDLPNARFTSIVSSSTYLYDVCLDTPMGVTVASNENGDVGEYRSALHVRNNEALLRLGIINNTPGDDKLAQEPTNNFISLSPGLTTLGTTSTQVGYDLYNSTLKVSQIYNFAGTSAPFFPAGVQYQDNTIQRTAWRGYDQGLI